MVAAQRAAFGGPQDHAGPLHAALQRVCEREQCSCQAWQKSAVKIYHALETLKTLDCCWLREVLDGGDVALKGAGSLCCDAVSQEIDGGLCKRTFLNVEHQSCCSQPLQDLSKVLVMRSVVRRSYQDIVDIAKGKWQPC